MKKSKQSNENNEKTLLDKIPLLSFLKRKWNYEKNIKEFLRDFHNERDPTDLEKIIPPESEKFEIHCAWVAEVFTPSCIDSLLESLKKLGWDSSENNRNKITLTDWVKQSRSYGNQRSWINGGIILSKNDNSKFRGSEIRRAKLPKGIDHCRLSLQNITSSITIVVIQFVFDDNLADSLNPAFRASHKTIINRKSKNITEFIDTVKQKRNLVQQKLLDINKNLHAWFHENIPGHFAISKDELPTINLVTTKKYKYDSNQKNILKDHYSDLLFDYGTENWTSKDIPELQMRLQPNKKSLGILFGNFGELTKKDMEQYGVANRADLVKKFNLTMNLTTNNTVGLWAIHHLLLSYEKHLSAIRDKAISPIKKIEHAIKNLNFIRSQFLTISTDIQAVSHDIKSLIKSKSYEGMDFTLPEYYKKEYPDLLELLAQQDEIRLKTLINQVKQVNESINASGNLTSAIANLMVQKNIFWLTIIITILTIFSVVLTIFSIFQRDLLLILSQVFEKINYFI